MKSILDFPFGDLWEREVLYMAGSKSFITIRICKDNKAPYIVHPFIRTSWSQYIQYYSLPPYIHTGTFVFVGIEWMKKNLSKEALASYIARKILCQ